MGNQVNQSFGNQTQQAENMYSNKAFASELERTSYHKYKKLELYCSSIGTIGGFISIFLGLVVSRMDTGSLNSKSEYGGDAYTGIQNAAAQTANNIQALAEIVKKGMSYALIVFGIAMIACFGIKCFKIVENLILLDIIQRLEKTPSDTMPKDDNKLENAKPASDSDKHEKLESPKGIDYTVNPTVIYCPFCGEELYINFKQKNKNFICPYCGEEITL